jgi:hypothetical protein
MINKKQICIITAQKQKLEQLKRYDIICALAFTKKQMVMLL